VPDELKTSVSWQPRIDSIENTPDQLPRLTMKMPFLAGRNVTVYPWHSDQAPVPPRHYILRNGQTVPLNRPEEAFGIKNIQVLLAGETKSDLEIAAFQLMHDRWAVKRYNNAYADWIAGKRRQNPQAMAWSDRPQFDVLLGNLSAQGETVEGIDDEEHVWHNLLLLHKLIMVGYDLSLSFTAYRRNSRIFPSRRPEPPARPPERLDAFSSLQELVSLPTPRRKGENNNEH
jgi:hypothetical protein